MSDLVAYKLEQPICTITLDDGKVNCLSPQMLSEINAALDQAEEDGAVVVIAGRKGKFSAGFDLAVVGKGGDEAVNMLIDGFRLAERLLSFPRPVVIACTGHALAMGSFLLLSVDYRIGADGAHKIGPNEVAIGMTMPRFGVEICRQRLAPAHFHRAVLTCVEMVGLMRRISPPSGRSRRTAIQKPLRLATKRWAQRQPNQH